VFVANQASAQSGGGDGCGVGVAVGDGEGAPQIRNKIDTLAVPWLARARSCMPSPLKSPTATELGALPTPKLVGELKLPAPLPNKIDTLFGTKLATARSCLLSPLKSPTITELGL